MVRVGTCGREREEEQGKSKKWRKSKNVDAKMTQHFRGLISEA